MLSGQVSVVPTQLAMSPQEMMQVSPLQPPVQTEGHWAGGAKEGPSPQTGSVLVGSVPVGSVLVGSVEESLMEVAEVFSVTG